MSKPVPMPQTLQDSGVAGVWFTLPATGQRTGAYPNSTPLATTASTSQLPSHMSECDYDDRDFLLKSPNRQHYTESSSIRISAFVEDAKNFLKMCGCCRDRWARFIISWLGPNKAKKVCRSHFIADGVNYGQFSEGLFILIGRLDFENAYKQQLRVLVQSGAESVAAFASGTTDLSTRAYPDFPTNLQLDLAVHHFISGRRDTSYCDYSRLEQARRRITWHKAV